jgi:hypothetical protein
VYSSVQHQLTRKLSVAVQGAIASCAAPLVGVIAQRGFDYDAATNVRVPGGGAAGSHADATNAAALGSSLLLCLGGPWTACFLIYFGLYRTYPADKARLKSSRSATPTP